MFGHTEILIILGVAVLVFGASRLPALGKGLGEGMRGFKDALKGEPSKDEALEKAEEGKKTEDDAQDS